MDKKKILLVNTNLEKWPYPVPPLGLCLLVNGLESRYSVRVYDGVFDEGRNLPDTIRSFQPDYIGFSIRNIDDMVKGRVVFYPDGIMEKFIRPAREVTGVPFILGGSGFSIFPDEIMEMTGAEYGIVGEAEDILPALLEKLDGKKDICGIPNLITKQNRTISPGEPCVRLSQSANRQFSQMDSRIDFGPYRERGVYSIQTKRGCAHGCIYCTYPLIEGRCFRTRPPAEIADEIAQVYQRLGAITFEIVDSTFNDPKGHAEDICREIIRKKIPVRLRTMGINPRHSSEELFELMMEAGFAQIDATPDSASPRVLKHLDKGFNLEDVQKMAVLIRKFNLPTMWFFLFGGPGEDEQTFGETSSFIDTCVNPADLVYMNAGLRIYPGTPLYDLAVRERKIAPGQSVFRPSVYYCSDRISIERLDALIAEAGRQRFNCLSSADTAPAPGMIEEAMQLRKGQTTPEPMFRTLLKVRKRWMEAGIL